MAEQLSIDGRRVRLRTTVADDCDALVAIRSTPEVLARWRGDDLAAEFMADLNEAEGHKLTIVDVSTDRTVGLIQFYEEQDPDYSHASIDIYVDPAVHRQGIATDAIRTLSDYLFDTRGLHRLTIDPAANNRAAIDCYAACGFQPIGVMRSYERQNDGSWADGLLMDMLASDR